MKKQSRIIGLDVLRVTCAFVIFLFHAYCHLGCSFSVLTAFIKMGPIFMEPYYRWLTHFIIHTFVPAL